MDVQKKHKPPTLRKFMHPRNPYKHPPSFKELALKYNKFRDHCTFDATGKVYFDFKNPEAVAVLTTCLLERDFNLKVNIPKGSLVPTLPLRFNYLLWIDDLLNMVYPKNSETDHKVVGCDIGTGSSAIYPLLGAKQFKWSFIASENDFGNYQSAKDNLTNNDLLNKIYLKHSLSNEFFDLLEERETKLFLDKIKYAELSTGETKEKNLDILEDKNEYKIDFTMCNPPFFSSEEDMESARRNKNTSAPSSAATGSLHEKVVDGGELSFITKMIIESTKHKDNVRLFSTLIGKQKDVKDVKKVLLEENVSHFKITEFCQGRTMRWGAVWTFDSKLILENYFSKKEKLNAKPLIIYIPRSQLFTYDIHSAWNLINSWLLELKIKPRIFKKDKYCIGAFIKAYKATWLHQRRKKRQERKVKRDANDNKRKMNNLVDNDDLDCKRIKLDNCDLNSTCDSESSVDTGTGQQKTSEQISNITDNSELNCNEAHKSNVGLECLIKANVLIVLKNGVLSIELKYLGGVNAKDSAFQIIQYLKNKVASGPHT